LDFKIAVFKGFLRFQYPSYAKNDAQKIQNVENSKEKRSKKSATSKSASEGKLPFLRWRFRLCPPMAFLLKYLHDEPSYAFIGP
jgi:hypothetical protein